MKLLVFHLQLTVILASLIVSGCSGGDPKTAEASETAEHQASPQENGEESYFGARFKEGKGVELSPEMKASIKLEASEVGEKTLQGEVTLSLQVISTDPFQTIAQVTEDVRSSLKIGTVLSLKETGETARVTKLSTGSLTGDIEALVEVDSKNGAAVKIGDVLTSTLAKGSAKAVTAVPASALLQTTTGTYVYVVNGKHYLRTEVKTGRRQGEFVEVTDGLYAGDEVVKQPVNLFWYTELQALRGGKACADGH